MVVSGGSGYKGGFEATLVKELRTLKMERREYKDITGERNPGKAKFDLTFLSLISWYPNAAGFKNF